MKYKDFLPGRDFLLVFFSALVLFLSFPHFSEAQNQAQLPVKEEQTESPEVIKITWIDLAFVNFFPLPGTRFDDFSDMNFGAETRINFMVFDIKPLWVFAGFMVDWNKTNSNRLDRIIDIAGSLGAGWRFPLIDRFYLTPKLSYGIMVHAAYGDYYNDPDIYPGDPRAGTKKNYLFSDQYMHYEAEFAYDLTPDLKNTQCEVFISPSFIHFIEEVRQGYEYGYMIGTRIKADTFFSAKLSGVNEVSPSILAGKVIDQETKKILSGAVSSISGGDSDKAELSEGETFAYSVAAGTDYNLKASHEGYTPAEYKVNGKSLLPGKKNSVVIELKVARVWGILDRIHEKDSNEPIKGVAINITDSTGKVLDVATDRDGKFSMEVLPDTDFKMIMKKKGYFTIRGEFTTKGKKPGWYEIMNLMTTDFQKSVVGATIEFGNINYDPSSANIRPDGMPGMDKMAQFLMDNPLISVELGSHTDTRGTHEVADALSQRRAESAMAYLIKKGIAPNRITSKGYGKRKLKNRCSDGVVCSGAEHQVNRRTELRVTEITKE